MKKQKKILTIHDISCTGRCSTTVVLPILSAAGADTAILPTAILSTHTGGFTDFTFHDMTQEIPSIINHWKSLDIKFDSIYSGYLGSVKQIEIVSNIFDDFKEKDTLIMVDPVMADNGKLYAMFNEDMVTGMKQLCAKADIIVPNMTEAAFMLDMPYQIPPYTEDYINEILTKLADMGASKIILTGVSFEEGKVGAAYYDKASNDIGYYFLDQISGYFHGTGDIFSSVVLSGLMNEFSLNNSVEMAAKFVYDSIKETVELSQELRYGVCFERVIPKLIKMLNLN